MQKPISRSNLIVALLAVAGITGCARSLLSSEAVTEPSRSPAVVQAKTECHVAALLASSPDAATRMAGERMRRENACAT